MHIFSGLTLRFFFGRNFRVQIASGRSLHELKKLVHRALEILFLRSVLVFSQMILFVSNTPQGGHYNFNIYFMK